MGRFEKLELSSPSVPETVASAVVPRADVRDRADRCVDDGAHEVALRLYSRALADDKHDERAWVGQLECLLGQGEFTEAIAWADHALGIFPRSAAVLGLKAVAAGRAGERDRAMALSDASLKAEGDLALAWWARGDLLASENARSAAHCFRKAAELAPDDARMALRAGRSWLSVGRMVEAERFLGHAVAADTPAAWFWLGVARRGQGRTAAAIACFERAVQLRPLFEEASAALADLRNEGMLTRVFRRLRWALARR